MKKSISILMVALLATGMSLTAQNRGNGARVGEGAKMGKPAMGMMKELNLTEDQKAKLQVLHQGFAVQDSVSKVQFKKQRESVRAERQLALAKILTPEQLLQLDKIRVEKGQKAGKEGQFGPGNGKQGFRQVSFAGQGRGQIGQGRGQIGQGRGQMGQGRAQMMGQRGQMTQMRGQMMNNRAQMLGNRGQMNRGGMQMRNGQVPFSKKDAKGFQKQAKRRNKAPMVNPEVRIKNQVEHMTKQLDLTPEQATQIQAIQTKHAKKEIETYQKFQKKHDTQFKERNAKFDEIKAVLTPEQVKKLDAQKEKAPKMQRKEGPKQGRK